MQVLIVGNGGREHALARALSRDKSVSQLFFAPGNPGTAQLGTNLDVSQTSVEDLVSCAKDHAIDLVVVGPEVPLVLGVADALRQAGIATFGPDKAAARIEGSKAFAKSVMAAAKVPTARSEVLDNPANIDLALSRFGPIWVVKDDGLASGKGVVVTEIKDVARNHAASLLDAGRPVLLESYLDGPEVSFFSFVSGTTVVPLIPSQDHKRLNDHDRGPNTGGMGAYAPLPWLSAEAADAIVTNIVKPVAQELVNRGNPFSGLLYTGLAVSSSGPAVVEFNCRFGDPEAQTVLELLETPLAGVLYATATGKLAELPPLEWYPGYAVTVVMASQSYPGKPRVGDVISGLEEDRPDVTVLHAATTTDDHDNILTSGGRVLSIVGRGETLKKARENAYERAEGISFLGAQYRRDIGLLAAEGKLVSPWELT